MGKKISKKERERQKEIAELYYMSGESQKTIALKLDVSAVSVNKWAEEGAWKIKKTAKKITRQEIILLMLQNAHDKLEAGALSADEMIKISAAIEKIDKRTNIMAIMEVFGAFDEYLILQMKNNPEVTPELLQVINKFQNMFMNDRLQNIKIIEE